MTPQETESKPPASAGGPPMEVWVSRGSPQGRGHWKVPLGTNPFGVHHQPYCRAPGMGVQPHPPADNWIKALLNKTLPTRERPVFSSPSHHEVYTSLLGSSIRGQTEEARSSLTAAKTKTILQKVNHVEKAESCVPGEETR